ncbi:MAG: hypothetical protein DKM50_00025 [Candidatus Margulisiibacteriota bacterium]|nr:MAG: hypothetical protein A2X43_03230 [Candidatus Margulisbacteria bacterium GWD2_39_127]OGI02183.1 MAG: hypothetical protein A2X42_08565 [Candidatus Margulisbacteria bacterium GWF2_38_17]OGI09021.1 MAG: hypothetical protein A2X41_01690 [Candidatus Margulisbacteria bacterium GWE2_39_32]PZM84988.1 MAG: hypothetical protein DKM50_00025 [Candidatus Margulisiibacteriota bacterium]HAR63192.1 hypothetical protein [Candidatus Margulisiibacteriota bacterium]
MNVALFNDIPKSISATFLELTRNNGQTLMVKDYYDLASKMTEISFDVIVLNYKDDTNEIEYFINKIKIDSPKSRIVVYGIYDTNLTIKYMRLGVDFCFTSNMPIEQMKEFLFKSIIYNAPNINDKMHKYFWFAGESKAIKELKVNLNDAIASNRNIIIRGQSGTGKSSISRIIHESSRQKDLQFKQINLSMYDNEYLENQFWITFHNLFESIESDIEGLKSPIAGTVYIEHLEEQSSDFIISLLNMISSNQNKINDSTLQEITPRIILPWKGQKDIFKEHDILNDNLYILRLPSLVERKEDIPLLIHTIIKKYAEKYNKDIKSISLEAFNLLMNYEWPGNIRELESILECAVLTATDPYLDLSNIGITMDMLYQVSKHNILGIYMPLHASIQKYQQALINTILETSRNDIDNTAYFLGLNKNELFNKMRLLNISINHN